MKFFWKYFLFSFSFFSNELWLPTYHLIIAYSACLSSFFLGQFHISGSSRSTPLFSWCIPSLLQTTVPAKRGQNFYLGQSCRTDNLTKQWQKISIMESFRCFTDLIILWVKPWPQSTLCSSLNTAWKESTR